VLDTADCGSIGSRLSAERRQEDLVLPFPQAAEKLQAQLSTASFPTPYSPQPGRGQQSQLEASPPLGPLPGPPGAEGGCRLESPGTQQHLPRQQRPANSHTRELLPGGQPWKGQKLCSSALLVLPSFTMGLRTLCTLPPALNYLDGSRKAQTSLRLCLQHASRGAVPALAGAWQSGAELPAACSSSLLPALGSKAELRIPTAQRAASCTLSRQAGLAPHREDTTRLLQQDRDIARGTVGNL